MTDAGEIRGPGGAGKVQPTQVGPTGPEGSGEGFSLEGAKSAYPPAAGEAATKFMQGRPSGKLGDKSYYTASRSDTKSGYKVSVNLYDKRPSKKAQPTESYPSAFSVERKKGKTSDRLEVSEEKDGKTTRRKDLDQDDNPYIVPSNFNDFKKQSPELFQKFYEALVMQIVMQTMTALKNNQKKMKDAMQGQG